MDYPGGSHFHSTPEGDQSAHNTRVDHLLLSSVTVLTAISLDILSCLLPPSTSLPLLQVRLTASQPLLEPLQLVRSALPWPGELHLAHFFVHPSTSTCTSVPIPVPLPAMFDYLLHVLYFYSAPFFGCQPRGLVLCPTALQGTVDIATNALRSLLLLFLRSSLRRFRTAAAAKCRQ